MKAPMVFVALMLVAGAVSVANVSAKQPDTWQMGTLIGLETRTTITEEIRNEHYEEREKKNGKKVVDGNSYAIDQPKVTYVLTVRIGDINYTVEHIKNLFFGYNPTDMVVNDPVTVSIQKDNLVLIRPDGKEYKTTVVRIARNERRAD